MISKPDKNKTRQKRHLRVRGKISGTAKCPRLNVYRSNKNIYAQIIDDVAGVTLVSASTIDSEVSGNSKTEQATSVGEVVAKRAVENLLRKLSLTVADIYIMDALKLLQLLLVKMD